LLNFPILLGSHRAKPSEWARLPSAKPRFLGGCPSGRNHDPKGGEAEAERRRAAGHRNGPEAATKQKAGYITADAQGTKVLVVLWLKKSGAIADALERPRQIQSDGNSSPELGIIGLEIAVSAVRRDREGEAAGLAASLDINLPLEGR
jgi:hypothetical protein